MVNDLVSIIIPCYNGENYIERCMKSLISQTYKMLEIIIINDGSIDNSEQNIQFWIDKLERQGYIFKYYFQDNQGLGAAINAGLKYVTGEFLTLLDIDDIYMPTSIEKRVKFLKTNSEFGMVRTNGWFVKEDPDTKPMGLFVYDDEEKKETRIFDDLLFAKSNNWAGTYMVRTNLLFKWYPDRNIYCSRFGQNLQIMLPVAFISKTGFIDEPLMKYIRHEKSLTVSDSIDVNERKKIACENYAGYFDIRKHMIDMLIHNSDSYQYYEIEIKLQYYRQLMSVALEYKDRDLLIEQFHKISYMIKPTLEDKIKYYSMISPLKVAFYKIYRKLNKILTGRHK